MRTAATMPSTEQRENKLTDPIAANPEFDQAESKIAVAGHPIHAMLVAFPIGLAVCALGADLFYWWTGDIFWARAALWSTGMAFLMGLLAGLSGTVELLSVPGIRARAASWTHFIIAMVLLSMLGANWGHRLSGYETAVLPYGLLLSILSVIFVGFAGWHGGKLVFDYQLGTSSTGS
jgi:uncharacterized membrane protein